MPDKIRSAWRILVVNPNTTQAMTEALKPVLARFEDDMVSFEYLTASAGVPSVNSVDDIRVSAEACLPDMIALLPTFDAFLVACYSPHPLVDGIHAALADAGLPAKPVTGIFEASVASSIASLRSDEKFGIVSTGAQWTQILDDGVVRLLGSHPSGSPRYAGTETTGLNANELHDAPKEQMRQLMSAATSRLLNKGARSICLGCAGMVGLDDMVRQACFETLGDVGSRVRIVDGVVSGAVHLISELRALQI